MFGYNTSAPPSLELHLAIHSPNVSPLPICLLQCSTAFFITATTPGKRRHYLARDDKQMASIGSWQSHVLYGITGIYWSDDGIKVIRQANTAFDTLRSSKDVDGEQVCWKFFSSIQNKPRTNMHYSES